MASQLSQIVEPIDNQTRVFLKAIVFERCVYYKSVEGKVVKAIFEGVV